MTNEMKRSRNVHIVGELVLRDNGVTTFSNLKSAKTQQLDNR